MSKLVYCAKNVFTSVTTHIFKLFYPSDKVAFAHKDVKVVMCLDA